MFDAWEAEEREEGVLYGDEDWDDGTCPECGGNQNGPYGCGCEHEAYDEHEDAGQDVVA